MPLLIFYQDIQSYYNKESPTRNQIEEIKDKQGQITLAAYRTISRSETTRGLVQKHAGIQK